MLAKFIGEDRVWNNLLPQMDKELKQNESYEVEIQVDGPQVIINGQPIISPDSTFWVKFPDGCSIPYAPDTLSTYWELP